MKQIDLADRLRVSTGRVSNWVQGSDVPKPLTCERIGEALDIDPDIVLQEAGHRTRDIEINPDSPQSRVIAIVSRFDPDNENLMTLLKGLIPMLNNWQTMEERRAEVAESPEGSK